MLVLSIAKRSFKPGIQADQKAEHKAEAGAELKAEFRADLEVKRNPD